MVLPKFSILLGTFIITPVFWTTLFAGFLSSFFFFRKLKDDFCWENIYKQMFFMIVVCLGLFFLLQKYNLAIFGVFFGAVLTIYFYNNQINKNHWEVLDALTPSLIIFSFFTGIGEFLSGGGFFYFLYCFLGVLGFVVYFYFKRSYRSFSWYKSGKTGFLFWSISFYVFLSLFAIDFFREPNIYFSKTLFFSTAIISVVMIYFRSERKIKEDTRFLFSLKRKNG